MKERNEYKIKVCGVLVDVTKEIYFTYYQMARRAKHLKEKDEFHGVVSYNELDTDKLLGEETMPDLKSTPVEDAAVHALMCEKLHLCIRQLTQGEQELLGAIYFEGKSEREFSAETGIPYMTIHDRKVKVLKKLKKYMEN